MARDEIDAKYADVPFFAAFATYMNYAWLNFMGFLRDFVISIISGRELHAREGYAPFVNSFEDFYTRHLYQRVSDCWGRPVCSAPGAKIKVLEREENTAMDWRTDLKMTGKVIDCINLASYNYLGYGELPGGIDSCTLAALDKYGVSMGSNHHEGRTVALSELEDLVAEFLDKEAAIVMGMGFATNSQLIMSLVGPGCLLISDALNHASIVVGSRTSGAKIKTFRHNDTLDLEEVIRQSIYTGQPGSGKPWKKILIIVEGVYSMEGEHCNLAGIVAVKKRYGAYLFLDEAHSIGAMGATGRGVCEHLGVDTRDIDIMMGTFTKSFGATGGYIAADKSVVDLIRYTSAGALYATTMSPSCVGHIHWVLNQIMGRDGTQEGQRRILQLRKNTMYLRKRLREMGLQIYGDEDSPVIPVMIYGVGKIGEFSRACLRRGLAVVVVGFPATPLILSRARICASAAHTTEQLDEALDIIGEAADLASMYYGKQNKRPKLKVETQEKIHQTDMHDYEDSFEFDDHSLCNGHCLLPSAAPHLNKLG